MKSYREAFVPMLSDCVISLFYSCGKKIEENVGFFWYLVWDSRLSL